MIPGLPVPLASLRTALAVAGAVAVVALLAGTYWLGRSHEADGWRLKAAQAAAATERAIALEQARQREIGERWQSTVDQQASELSNARTTINQQAARLRALSLDSSRLRDQLTSYAAGSPGEDSLAACHARAAALSHYAADLGAVASEIAIAARQSAIERDEFAAEVTALLRAWPRAGER